MRVWKLRTACIAAVLGVTSICWASPHSEVASALDEDDRFDLHLTLDYGFELHRANVLREYAGLPGTAPTDPMPLAKDLRYAGSRQLLTPRLEVGVFTDLAFTVALPLVLSDSRSLSFSSGIDRSTSTTVRDGLLSDSGFNADDPNGPGFATGDTIFRGPGRAGLDQIHLGLVWAAMNQTRDNTKPTWKIGAEPRLAIGSPMRLDATDPGSDTGVGRGLHELRLWTSFARRVGWAEPYMTIWWLTPLGQSGDSAFESLGFGQESSAAQQRGGVTFGAEFEVWRRAGASGPQWITVDGSAYLEANFEGRGYSEMWEVFQYAGTPRETGPAPLVLDADPVQPGRQQLTHPGVTAIENYLRVGGHVGAKGHFATARFGVIDVGANFGILSSQSHTISYADVGEDLPTCSAAVSQPCEVEDNAVVDPDTAEVNPGYVPLIDFAGSRYRVDDIFDYIVRIEARILF
ncbi:MAG: hypothetical protein Tsb0020_13510 [Haliangiales bacterium]